MDNGAIDKINFTQKFNPKKFLPFSILSRGIPLGALIEVSGPAGGGKTEVVLQFLAENPQLKVAWVENSMTIYPCVFLEKKLELNRVLFVETLDLLWVAHQVLKSQIFGVLVLPPTRVVLNSSSHDSSHSRGEGLIAQINEVQLRRLQIAAEKAQVSVFLLTEMALEEGAWPISVQIQVRRETKTGNLQLTLLKCRGGGR